VRWRLIDLAQWVFEEFRVSISKPALSRELRTMGFRKLSARPRHHAQDEEAAAAFKKTAAGLSETVMNWTDIVEAMDMDATRNAALTKRGQQSNLCETQVF
jgi:hypothetical protein